ncbi:MAG: hypothetical protein KGL39_45860 [Patescibacteria group bacterium]|nr:hypothetical protein [Patescibacteria group bacterium]
MTDKSKPATRKYVDEVFSKARERIETLAKAVEQAPTVQPAPVCKTGWTQLTITRQPDGRLRLQLR